MYATLSASFEQAQQKGAEGGAGAAGAAGAAELDEIKRMLLETNPILLITTFVVSVLHMVFEILGECISPHFFFGGGLGVSWAYENEDANGNVIVIVLAFTADVGHWRRKKELTGVSVRYVVFLKTYHRLILCCDSQNHHHECLRSGSHSLISC